ncbi:hypothetical protein GALMADRAFT_282866 [Galerina marginata CBS 339.88]|uniref:Protein kinase domain-containing protein n=1 Tax=Galerina marginata (strain CBS 339.88) TaxID=685588 RepID=A0A067SCR1_GALM3|nr:hypothetical protein GALMADRAFT_282866 [Galerina marginata CBS 339.88]
MTLAGKSILKQMQRIRRLRWEVPRTLGFKNVSIVDGPLDAEIGFLRHAKILPKGRTKLKANKGRTKDKGIREDETNEMSSLGQKKSAYVTVSRRPMKSVRHYLDAHQYIQHAWARAAKQDSTFMVFNCGIYERIGVRHRESQTLYLSPLIETINCRDPPYGKLHLGLHTAIVQDFLERYDHDTRKSAKNDLLTISMMKTSPKPKPKGPNSRCRRQVPTKSNIVLAQLSSEMSKRELALITLNYGPYCSPAPASFLRCGSSCVPELCQPFEQTNQSKFSSTQYFELVLGEPLGTGAVGVVHPASLSTFFESGRTLRQSIVVKLAFSDEQKSKLENDFKMYSILASAEEPVEGIVTVHGLFEDPESGALALFMEHGGQSFRELDKKQPERDEQLRKEERLHSYLEEYTQRGRPSW